MKLKVLLFALPLLCASCMTVNKVANGVPDARKNLIGDRTRTYTDIVEASVHLEGDTIAFTVKTASRMPEPRDFGGGKRVDFIWFVDADRNTTTGQNKDGNDYNLHLFLDETGWHTTVAAVSELSQAVGNTPRQDACPYRVEDTTLILLVPQRTFPDVFFDWWAQSTTVNAPDWAPVTENPVTKRTSTKSKV